jgi:hypothetical protein
MDFTHIKLALTLYPLTVVKPHLTVPGNHNPQTTCCWFFVFVFVFVFCLFRCKNKAVVEKAALQF